MVNSLTTRLWAHDYDRPIERKMKKKKARRSIPKKKKIMLNDEIEKKLILKKNKTRLKSTCANL